MIDISVLLRLLKLVTSLWLGSWFWKESEDSKATEGS